MHGTKTGLFTVTGLNNALVLKAPLANPALTGTPTAPTAAQTVNNTQIATTAFVKAAVAGLVGSSPEALDTLNELAAALGNDPNFATTVMNALAGKQPLDNTLTALAGKSISGIIAYLGLNDVALAGVATGTLASTGVVSIPIIVSGIKRNFVIQWGGGDIPRQSTSSVTLPVSFDNNCLAAFAVKGSAISLTAEYACGCTPINNSTISISNSNAGSGSTQGIRWLVIGH